MSAESREEEKVPVRNCKCENARSRSLLRWCVLDIRFASQFDRWQREDSDVQHSQSQAHRRLDDEHEANKSAARSLAICCRHGNPHSRDQPGLSLTFLVSASISSKPKCFRYSRRRSYRRYDRLVLPAAAFSHYLGFGFGFVVSDKAAEIDDIEPGRSDPVAAFSSDEAIIESITKEAVGGAEHFRWFEVSVKAQNGELIATEREHLDVRLRQFEWSGHLHGKSTDNSSPPQPASLGLCRRNISNGTAALMLWFSANRHCSRCYVVPATVESQFSNNRLLFANRALKHSSSERRTKYSASFHKG